MSAILELETVAGVDAIRARFPALGRLHGGVPVAYFDGPGGTQVPVDVADAMRDYLFFHNANTHWNYPSSAETDAMIAEARERMAMLFNANAHEVSFGNNMTTITFHVARALGRAWGPGDEIVVTELDHHANIAPWMALERERGITVRWARMIPETGTLDWESLERAVTPRTKLLAVGAASNALGTVTDVPRAVALARSVGALTYVDAVHYAAHGVMDVQAWGCDFLVCSPYKFYGPHAGVLYARADVLAALDVPKLAPAPNEIPERLETGTQNHEGIVGSGAAVAFLSSLSGGTTITRERVVRTMQALHVRGDVLFRRLWNELGGVPGVRRFGVPPGEPRTPTLSFVVDGVPSEVVAGALARQGVFLSHGDFYAATIVERLGYAVEGIVRVGCACYTTADEIDRVVEGIRSVVAGR